MVSSQDPETWAIEHARTTAHTTEVDDRGARCRTCGQAPRVAPADKAWPPAVETK